MTLTVGTDTYISLSDMATYVANRGFSSAWTGEDSAKEAALRIACKHLDYSYVWRGEPTSTSQALAWPRSGVYSRNGAEISSTVVPQDIIDAQCELALQWIGDDQLMPTSTYLAQSDLDAQKGGVQREKLGDLEKEYRVRDSYLFALGSYAPLKKIYPYVDLLVSAYYSEKVGGSSLRIIV